MIEGVCITAGKDDVYWPKEFAALPRVGDLVRQTGEYGGKTGIVTKVIHCHDGLQAFIEIYLNIQEQNRKRFLPTRKVLI